MRDQCSVLGCQAPVNIANRWSLVVSQMLIVVAFVLPTIARAQDRPIALKGGKLLTVTHGTIENGVLVIENGKIAAVGAAASLKLPRDARVVDVTGMTVYPGLIDSETNLGLTEISAEQSTNDLIENSDEIMPHMHIYDAFHAESELIPVSRVNGVTNAIVAPENRDTLPSRRGSSPRREWGWRRSCVKPS